MFFLPPHHCVCVPQSGRSFSSSLLAPKEKLCIFPQGFLIPSWFWHSCGQYPQRFPLPPPHTSAALASLLPTLLPTACTHSTASPWPLRLCLHPVLAQKKILQCSRGASSCSISFPLHGFLLCIASVYWNLDTDPGWHLLWLRWSLVQEKQTITCAGTA